QRVQLSYDDGPDTAGNTRLVLDALNAAGARATFYLVGKRVAQGENWRVVFDMAAKGHWLGNHAFDWNDATDNHIFLQGTVEERAEKILETEWAIRDALIRGRDNAVAAKSWDAIPAANRAYIDDVIAHGTGRFRTPGFKSKTLRKPSLGDPNPLDQDGITTAAAIASASKVLVAVGLYPLKTTEPDVWGPDFEGVTVDPKDWEANRTKDQITSGVKTGLKGNADSILLHSRVAATAQATPAIVAAIKSRKFSFDPTVRGTLGAGAPGAGFAGLAAVSDPPTPAQIGDARSWLKSRMLSMGPYLSGSVAVGIFQLAQKAGPGEVLAFAAEIKATKVTVDGQDIPMANWMNDNPEWRLFAGFFENWATRVPFPRQPAPPN
ncbi:MAG: polysaccharide deacetylase family protein, partial [Specibacter sp.]